MMAQKADEARLDPCLRSRRCRACICLQCTVLVAKLCQYMFRVGGGGPLPGPLRAGEHLQGSGGLSPLSLGRDILGFNDGCSHPKGRRARAEGRHRSLPAGLSQLARLTKKPGVSSKEHPSAFARLKQGREGGQH